MNFSFGPIASLQYVGRVFESHNELHYDKNSAQKARHPRLQAYSVLCLPVPGVFSLFPDGFWWLGGRKVSGETIKCVLLHCLVAWLEYTVQSNTNSAFKSIRVTRIQHSNPSWFNEYNIASVWVCLYLLWWWRHD